MKRFFETIIVLLAFAGYPALCIVFYFSSLQHNDMEETKELLILGLWGNMWMAMVVASLGVAYLPGGFFSGVVGISFSGIMYVRIGAKSGAIIGRKVHKYGKRP